MSDAPVPAPSATEDALPLLDLDRRRNVGELLESTFRIFGQNAGVLYVLTLLVYAPATFLIDGVWGKELRDGVDAELSVEQGIVSGLLTGLVLPSLVTAIHVVVVQRLASGEAVTMRGALATAARRLGVVSIVSLLYMCGVLGGFVLLIVPGVWLSVVWYFGAQAAMAEDRRAWEAMRRSREIVRGQWWRTAALLTLSWVLFSAMFSPLFAAVVVFDSGLPYVTLTILYETLLMSITALFATLLFFDLRARADDRRPYPSAPQPSYRGFLPPGPPA